jgi:hypothetical protein
MFVCPQILLFFSFLRNTSQLPTTAYIHNQYIAIVSQHVHPKFVYEEYSYDQMLLKLDKELMDDVGLSVVPVRINFNESIPTSNAQIGIIGYGQTITPAEFLNNPTSRLSVPSYLQETTVEYVPNRICETIRDDDIDYSTIITDDMVCVHNGSNQTTTNATGQCNGDSGGPYLLRNDSPEKDVQIGIVSWGINCAHPVFPSVGSRTSADTNFIRRTACVHSTNPPSYFHCDEFRNTDNSPSERNYTRRRYWVENLGYR